MRRSLVIAFCMVALAAAASIAVASTKADDHRLDQRVTLDIQGRPLKVICQQLETATGIIIRTRDPASQRKLTIQEKDASVRSVLDSIHNLTGYVWSQTVKPDTDGNPCYVFWRDQKTELNEEFLRNQATSATSEKLRADTEKELTSYWAALQLDTKSEEFQKLKETDPWAYLALTNPKERSGIEYILSLSDDTLSSISNGPGHRVPYSKLAPHDKRLVDSFLNINPDSEEEATLWQNRKDKMIISVGASSEGISLMARFEDKAIGGEIMRPASLYAEQGRNTIRVQDGMDPVTSKALMKQERDQMQQSARKEAEEVLARKIAGDPALLAEIEIKFDPDQPTALLSTLLQKIATASGKRIFADHFSHKPLPIKIAGQHQLYVVLETICRQYGCDWEKKSGTILIHDNDWYDKVLSEIPENLIDRWMTRVKDNGRLELTDLCEIASQLSDSQLDSLPDVPGLYNETRPLRINTARAVLRFYAVLDQSQRSLAMGDGLKVSSFTPAQWNNFIRLYDRLRSDQPVVFDPNITQVQVVGTADDNVVFKFQWAEASSSEETLELRPKRILALRR